AVLRALARLLVENPASTRQPATGLGDLALVQQCRAQPIGAACGARRLLALEKVTVRSSQNVGGAVLLADQAGCRRESLKILGQEGCFPIGRSKRRVRFGPGALLVGLAAVPEIVRISGLRGRMPDWHAPTIWDVSAGARPRCPSPMPASVGGRREEDDCEGSRPRLSGPAQSGPRSVILNCARVPHLKVPVVVIPVAEHTTCPDWPPSERRKLRLDLTSGSSTTSTSRIALRSHVQPHLPAARQPSSPCMLRKNRSACPAA